MISRRILAAVALLCALVIPAQAQKTRAQLNTEIGTSFPDNNFPLLLRNVTNDIVNSIMPTAPVVSGNLACFSGTTGLLQDCGSVPNTLTVGTSVIAGGTSNGLLYNNSGILGNLATANSGVVVTSNTGVPSITSGPLGIDHGGLGATSFTANLPIIGNGSSNPIVGSRSGNTTVFATSNGALTANDCVKVDAGGNFVDAGATCGANANTPYVQDFLAGTGFTAGTSTSITLMNSPSAAALLAVSFDGVVQSHNTWSLAGPVVTFNAAIPANTRVVEAHWYAPSTTAGVGNLNGASGALNLLGVNGATVATLGQNISVGLTPFLYNPVTNPAYAGGAKCNGSNDSAAIQAAINALPGQGGYIDIPGLCYFATPLDFRGHPNLILRGQGGLSGGANTPSLLIYTGGSAPRALDFRDSSAVLIEGLSIIATNPSFTGFLIDAAMNIAATENIKFSDLTMGANYAGGTAPGCINMSGAISFIIDRVNFARCSPGIYGPAAGIGVISNNQFVNTIGSAIHECGANWLLTNNAFEPDVNGVPNAMTNSPSLPCNNMTSIGNWHGDVTSLSTGSSNWYNITSNGFISINDFVAADVIIGGDRTFGAYNIIGGGGYTFRGSTYQNLFYVIGGNGLAVGCRLEGLTTTGQVATIFGPGAQCIDTTAENNNPNVVVPLPSWVPVLTPSITPGSFAYSINYANYRRRGNYTMFWLEVVINTLSTAAGRIDISGLPVTLAQDCPISGWDALGKLAISGSGGQGSTSFSIFKYDGGFPAVSGSVLRLHATCPTN
jgi:hypothetical protein